MREALETAREAALAGAAVLRERAGTLGTVPAKSSFVDFVTDSDIASGVAVVSAIAERREAARFVVEESEVYELTGTKPASLWDDEVWVIDPIDGTTSYMHGFPCYSVSVAMLRSGRPVAGAVYNVPADEMFSAADGLGADRNGAPISASTASTPEQALVVTGFPYDRTEPLKRQLGLLARALEKVHGVRRDGSAAVDCCHVACGRADAYWELGLSPWDLAAGACHPTRGRREADRARRSDWTIETRDVLAANRQLHPGMMSLLGF